MYQPHRFVGIICAMLSFAGSAALADHVKLKDGTTIEGVALKEGDKYWVKAYDGSSRFIDANDIASIQTAPDPAASSAGTSAPASADRAAAASGTWRDPASTPVRYQAERVDSPLAAVAIWQQFIDNNPSSPDLQLAQSEKDRWKALADTGAERINGRWIGGGDLKNMQERAAKLVVEAEDLLKNDQTLQAITKLQSAARIYPNSPQVNYFLGKIAMEQRKYDDALKYFEANLRLHPDAAESMNNVGVALYFKRTQWERAILTLQRAAELQDSKVIAQNLANAILEAPDTVKKSSRIKPAIDAADVLVSKYKLKSATTLMTIMAPAAPKRTAAKAEAASAWSGSGFFITADGLILTNRHVADGAKTLMVMVAGQEKAADVVAIDDEQDLALIRLHIPAKVPFVFLSPRDEPGDGADCTVLGYPLIDRLGADIKVTRGIVSSALKGEKGPNVMTDAKVNPGNSGGPIFDRYGNVMAIVCMKSLSSATEDSYGIGISAGHIRQFLAKQKLNLPPGTMRAQLSAEDIATMATPATVCIVATK